jgi:hypothetical protein
MEDCIYIFSATQRVGFFATRGVHGYHPDVSLPGAGTRYSFCREVVAQTFQILHLW